MLICKRLVVIFGIMVAFELATMARSEDNKVIAKRQTRDDNDDYFYDSSMSKEEIEKKKQEKAEAEEKREKEEEAKKPKESDPEWFKRGNETDDPMAKFMEDAIKEYMKKMQKEYMEKMKAKKKSDINHPFWSVVTLAVFFGTGILIGLTIVVIRGNSFNKGSRLNSSNGKKTPANGGRDSINRSAYVSVPQKEQITI